MPVAFRELDDPAGPERAAVLRIIVERDGRRLRGALLITNGIGEPIELAFARLASPVSVLCSGRRASLHSAGLLASALFEKCRVNPDVLLFRESETPPELFEHRIRLAIPAAAACESASGTVWRWVNAGSAADEPIADRAVEVAAATVDRLAALDLLADAFARAERALVAALDSETCDS